MHLRDIATLNRVRVVNTCKAVIPTPNSSMIPIILHKPTPSTEAVTGDSALCCLVLRWAARLAMAAAAVAIHWLLLAPRLCHNFSVAVMGAVKRHTAAAAVAAPLDIFRLVLPATWLDMERRNTRRRRSIRGISGATVLVVIVAGAAKVARAAGAIRGD
jgi:hypothetical protein